MSCCPPVPPIKVSNGAGFENAGHESTIQPGESAECYMARAGNQTGGLDDATDNLENKIKNSSIPVSSSDLSVNVTFEMTVSQTPSAAVRTPTSWTLTKGGAPFAVSGVTFTSLSATATLVGTFPDSENDKPYEVLLTASDGSTIDARTFKFSPSKSTNTNSLRLLVPLPGGVCNSVFSTARKNPVDGVVKPHKGIDMKMENKSVVDVVAAADGEVVFKGLSGSLTRGYGQCVKIKHSTGSGNLLCYTMYAHLAKFYVEVGQKVAAGQKIGLEGTTGSSTGNHLHFELVLPNGLHTDPLPYFTTAVKVTDRTAPNGDPAPGSLVLKPSSGAALTEATVSAKSSPCPASGVNPLTGAVASSPANAPADPADLQASSDPFEHAWYFTMTYEVGPHWKSQPQFSPGDPDLDAGLYDTDLQRKKCGYKGSANFPGGETKFGVAQKPNKETVVVKDLKYLEAKSFGKSKYWDIGGATDCNTLAPLIAIMIFDMNYLHGSGNARTILSRAAIGSVPLLADKATQLAACEKIHQQSLVFLQGMNPAYLNGWTKRANARYAFVKSRTYPLGSPP